MNVLLIVLLGSFVGYVLLRLLRRSAPPTYGSTIAFELIAGSRDPSMVLHAAGLLLLLVAATWYLWRTPHMWGPIHGREAIGALLVLAAFALMAWSIARLRSWRLLPMVDANHELCIDGPYAWVRHPMYLAIDLLGLGVSTWTAAPLAWLATALLLIGGAWRAAREEAALLVAFGDQYRAYQRRVRRLIPFLY